jgi:hypothetical protein
VIPLVQWVEVYDMRDQIDETTVLPDAKKGEWLKVQTKEGLGLGLAVTVRFRLDPRRWPRFMPICRSLWKRNWRPQ